MTLRISQDPIMGAKLVHQSLESSRLTKFTVASLKTQNYGKETAVKRIRNRPDKHSGRRVYWK